MPVKFNTILKTDDFLMGDMVATDIVPFESYSAETLLSDDIWNKFELPLEDALVESGFSEFEDPLYSSLFKFDCEIRNHDCMWAGHCGSKEHPTDEPKQMDRPNQFIHTAASANTINAPAKQNITAGRSLLLKTQLQNSSSSIIKPSNTPIIDSPPNSDDEESKSKTVTLQLLQDAISECDLEDDSDLYEYFEDEELLSEAVDEPQQRQPSPRETTAVAPEAAKQFTSDHCYHKDSMRSNNYGIETPSDSEEEIDVVSVGDKQTAANRMVCALPNNPTSRDKQQLQRTMQSAMNKNGIKTLLPRKPTMIEHTPVKRRTIENRGIKRGKHRSPPTSPYKKRSAYNHSSDSEQEPSEKRNLHNNMERQRRIDLRNAFEDLRSLVPEVSKKDRAPKVVILREASIFCDHLSDISESMHREVDELKRRQKQLRARVSQLRLSLAAKHR